MARGVFEDRAPVSSTPGTGTGYDHRKRLAARRGEDVVEKIPIPDEFAYLLRWYDELRGRALRGMRFEPIQFSEIKAYKELFDLPMDEFDIDCLMRLDGQWHLAQPDASSSAPPPRR